MLRVDHIVIDGAETELPNGYPIPASEVFNWPVHDAGARLSPWISPTERRVWHPERYERAVSHVLARIFSTRSGTALRNALLRGPSRILPLGQRDQTTPAAEFRYSAMSGARVLYTPAAFSRTDREPPLFHELVHLSRHLAGVYRRFEPANSPERYDLMEEFVAVVISNIFRSETGRLLLWGHRDLSTPLTNPTTWINHPRNGMMIERIRQEMPGFAASLAQVPAQFNPFRAN